MKDTLQKYKGNENTESAEYGVIERARTAFFEANPQLAKVLATSQMPVTELVEALQQYQTLEEKPKAHTHSFRWNPQSILETSPVYQILGVTNLKDYPEGVRAGLKKLFKEMGVSKLDSQQLKGFLLALNVQGFKYIGSDFVGQVKDCPVITPEWLIEYAVLRINWLEEALSAMLEIVEPGAGPIETAPDKKDKELGDVIAPDLEAILTSQEAYRKLANEPVPASPMEVQFEQLVAENFRGGSLTLPTGKVQAFTQESVPEGQDPLEFLLQTVTDAWHNGEDMLSIKGMQTLRPIGHEVDLGKHWESTKPNGK